MNPTTLTYMHEMDRLKDEAHIVAVQQRDDGKYELILDHTIFYPQGGGQPFDQGTIENDNALFTVEEVRFKDGIVYHIGSFARGSFTAGMPVTLRVDEARRLFNSRNHAAGHLIDIAMQNIGLDLEPGRAYHFPEGAYVEYCATMDETERETLIPKLEQEVTDLIAKAHPVTVQLVSYDELKKVSRFVPSYLPKDKPTRAMIVGDYFAIPCGGTHVSNTQQVKKVSIEKIKNKKGNVRISYAIH
jgi:Ser-tRNA(Ala) deacylase AlaX